MTTSADEVKLSLRLINSYTYYHESKYYEVIFQSLKEELGVNGKVDTRALRWFVSNTARCLHNKAIGYYLRLREGHYVNNPQKISARGVRRVLDNLVERGYIELSIGGVKRWYYEDGSATPKEVTKTFLVFNEEYLDMWRNEDVSINLWSKLEDLDLIELRERSTKKPMSLRGREGVVKKRNWLKMFNEFMKDADITFDGEPIADVKWKRVYSDNMRAGGRFYANGGGVQNIPALMRRSLLRIDGESVVEIDYRAMHPNICYTLIENNHKEIDIHYLLGEDFDAYAVPTDHLNMKVEQEKISEWGKCNNESHNPVRNLIKLGILIAMNCRDYPQALAALNYKIREDRLKPKMEQEFYGIEGIIPASGVLTSIVDHNDFIRDSFYSDFGVYAQNYDSAVMERVVDTMMQLGHTTLIYHDSAIVKKGASDDLERAMIDAWQEVFGNTKFCKVEVKGSM